MNNRMHEIADADFDNLVKDLRSSLAIRSVLEESQMTKEHPFGKKLTEALDNFLNCAKGLGFEVKNIANMAGYAEIGEGERLIGVLAHLDVVPEGEASSWNFPPYAGEISNNVLYGRGTMDDKGPAFSALYAAKALRDSGAALNCRIRVIVGIDEESGSRCMERYLETEEVPSCSFSPDAAFPIINAEKGIMNCYFEKEFGGATKNGEPRLLSMNGGIRYNVVPDRAEAVFDGVFSGEDAKKLASLDGIVVKSIGGTTTVAAKGVTAHAMCPDTGVNAITKLFNALAQVRFAPADAARYIADAAKLLADTDGSALGVARSDEVSGPLTCNAGMMSFKDSKLRVCLDLRYPVTHSGKELAEDLEKSIAAVGASLTIVRDSEPLFVEPDHPLVRKLKEAWKNITGDDAVPMSIGGGTYCRSLPNAVSFGPIFPGEPDLDHQPNEHLKLDDLRKMTHLYAEALSLLAE